ncbi:hypothetical protein RCL1_000039 [Eukaryota sp. TZLM3-RCL]
MSNFSFSTFFSFCVDLSLAASALIRNKADTAVVYAKDVMNLDFVTSVDLEVEKMVVSAFKYTYPDILVIGEEDVHPEVGEPIPREYQPSAPSVLSFNTFSNIDPSKLCVWIDPLDGTLSFIQKKYDGVTFLLGITLDGVPIAGIITHPIADPSFIMFGVVGWGLFKNFSPFVAVSPKADLIITTSDTHYDKCKEMLSSIVTHTIQRLDGTGRKFLSVLQGESHVFLLPLGRTKKWDSCAGHALLRCIGGETVDTTFSVVQYVPFDDYSNSKGLIAFVREFDLVEIKKLFS